MNIFLNHKIFICEIVTHIFDLRDRSKLSFEMINLNKYYSMERKIKKK